MSVISTDLNDNEFNKISELVYRLCGICLTDGKKALVRSRLLKRLRDLGLPSIREYIKYIEGDNGKQEMGHLVDVMTTNKTSFFREIAHFNFLVQSVLPELKRSPRIRLWTAACSSGEEAFSLAILLRENVPGIEQKDVKILATDISMKMLKIAQAAIYREGTIDGIQPEYLAKYFTKVSNNSSQIFQVNENIRSLVRVTRLNLIDTWPMKGPFNIIFCRNVMIYFDKPTQQKLINRFWDILGPGGYLFVGHSEGLSSICHKFKFVQPATYMK